MTIRNCANSTELATAVGAYVAGDTININYSPVTTRITFARSGSAGSHVTVNGDVTFQQGFVVSGSYLDFTGALTVTPGSSALTDDWGVGQATVSGGFNTFASLDVHGVSMASPAKASGLLVTGSDNTFTNPVVYNVNQCGVWLTNNASRNTLIDPEVYDYGGLTGIGNEWDYPGTGNTFARMYVHGVSGFNTDSGSDGDGVLVQSPNTTIDRATICVKQRYDPRNVPTGTGKHTDNFVFDQNMNGLSVTNSVIGNMDLSESFNAACGNTCVEGAVQNSAYTFHFGNCVFISPDAGASSATNPADNPWIVQGTTTGASTVYNCVFYGKSSGFPAGTKFRNCIFIQTTNSPAYASSMAAYDCDYCLFVGPSLPTGAGAHSVRVAANSGVKWAAFDVTAATQYGLTADWSLASDSPAKGAGTDVGYGADMGVTGVVGALTTVYSLGVTPGAFETIALELAGSNIAGDSAWASTGTLKFASGSAEFAVKASVAATGRKGGRGVAAFTPSSTMAALGAKQGKGGASFSASAAPVATGRKGAKGSAAYAAKAFLSAIGEKGAGYINAAAGIAVFTVGASLTATGTRNIAHIGTSAVRAAGSLVAVGAKHAYGIAAFSVGAHLSAGRASDNRPRAKGSISTHRHGTGIKMSRYGGSIRVGDDR